ncbi:MAG TPA: peptidylprolyl isomerase [Polyangiaceae bacterium]|jgi:parvulin-like peptidyl-prolyl isomerase
MSFIALSSAARAVAACLLASGCVVTPFGGPGQVPDVPEAPRPRLSAPQRASGARSAGAPAEIRARHVLVAFRGATKAAPDVTRTREEALARMQEVIERLKNGEPFEGVAAKYSDDPSAAQNHGDLGRFNAKQMVPAFSEAAFALEPGKLSDVVETPFGFHVIQRTE